MSKCGGWLKVNGVKCGDTCHSCFSLFYHNSPRYVVAKVNYNLYRV